MFQRWRARQLLHLRIFSSSSDPGSCSLTPPHSVGISEVQASVPLSSCPVHRGCASGGQAHLVLSLFPTDIGPVTLTSDPAVFQRELRELFVQVGCPALAAGPLCPSSQSMPEAQVIATPRGQDGASYNDLPPNSAWGSPSAWRSWRFHTAWGSFLYSVTQVPTGVPVPGT